MNNKLTFYRGDLRDESFIRDIFSNQYKKNLRYTNIISISLGDNKNDIDILNNSNYSGIIKNNTYKILSLNKIQISPLLILWIYFYIDVSL